MEALLGGRPVASELRGEDEERDKRARLKISAELGHSKLEVVAYISE